MPYPVISVIMATYNREGFLNRSIDSILEQSFTDFEFIIVNDGSSDNTAEVLGDYEKRDGRIRVITQKNQGPATSWNNGANAARGEYLAFMDDDDASGVYRLEVQLDALRSHPDCEACVTIMDNIGENSSSGEKPGAPEEIKAVLNTSPVYEHLNLDVLDSRTLITRRSFLAAGGFRTQSTIIEDLDFTLRYSRKHKWLWLPECPLYFYDTRENGRLSAQNTKEFIKRHIACYVSEWCRHKDLADPVEENKTLAEIIELAPTLSLEAKDKVYASLYHMLYKSWRLDIYALRILGYRRKPNQLITFSRFANNLYRFDRRFLGGIIRLLYRSFLKRTD